MAARSFLVLCGIWLSMIGAGICLAQEVNNDPTVEEIVARHEATWAKLRRLEVNVASKGRITVDDDAGLAEQVSEVKGRAKLTTSEIRSDLRIVIDGERVSTWVQMLYSKINIQSEAGGGLIARTDEQDVARGEVREIVDGKISTSLTPSTVEIHNVAKWQPRIEKYWFGRSIAVFFPAPQRSLKQWIAHAKPKLTRKTNDAKETIFVLEGKFESNINPTLQPWVRTFKADHARVVVNADRGYLIEQVDFRCLKLTDETAPKSSQWIVNQWHDLGNGLYFPARVRSELNNWNIDENSSFEIDIKDVKVDPVDLERNFEFEFKDGVTVRDFTDRSDATPVCIWGSIGTPHKVYATHKAHDDEQEAIRLAELGQQQEKAVSKMFPGCTVKATWNAKMSDFHTTVYNEKGEQVREFKSNEELAVVESIQELIRFAMGKKELK